MFGLKVAATNFQNKSYDSASNAVLEFWANDVFEKGLLDEYFPNQKSFCASAYTSMAASITMVLDVVNNKKPKETHLNALKICLDQLAGDKKRPVSANQTLAAHLAHDLGAELLHLSLGNNPFQPELIEGSKIPSEYNGIDLGYSLKCIDICVLALVLIKDSKKREFYSEILMIYLDFLSTVAEFGFHPSLGSRGNPHALFGGLSVLSEISPAVSSIFKILNEGDIIPEFVKPANCDDKYLAFFHLTSQAIPLLQESLGKQSFLNFCYESQKLESFDRIEMGQLTFLKTPYGSKIVYSNQSGAYLRSQAESRVFFSGYLYEDSKGEVYIPSNYAAIEAITSDLQITHYSARFKERAEVTQNLLFSTVIKFLLVLPVVSTVFRNYIYRKTQKVNQAQPYGISRISLEINRPPHFEWLVKAKRSWLANGWIFIDGHATRLYGNAQNLFKEIDN